MKVVLIGKFHGRYVHMQGLTLVGPAFCTRRLLAYLGTLVAKPNHANPPSLITKQMALPFGLDIKALVQGLGHEET